MANKKITDIASGILEDFLDERGYELYHIEFVKEGRDWFLRIYIDFKSSIDNDGMESFINIEDCENVSRYLSKKLDEIDPIEQNYYLEVSSPGIDRLLIKPEHFERYIGSEIEIKLYKPIGGVKNIEGTLIEFLPEANDYKVTIRDYKNEAWTLSLSEIAKANKAVNF